MLNLTQGLKAQSDLTMIDKLALECSAGNTESCNELKNIALKEKKYEVRLAAVKKLDDQDALYYIAKNEIMQNIRYAAINQLKNQQLLLDLAKNSKSYLDQIAAVKKISDQKILLEIALNRATRHEVASAAVENITDPELLDSIAKNTFGGIQNSAKRQLSSLELKEYELRIAAYLKANNQKTLNIEKIIDEKILFDIATHASYKYRLAALKKITTSSLIFKVSEKNYLEIQILALIRLNGDEYYNQFVHIINKNNDPKTYDNYAALCGLKIIPKDKTLNSYYKKIAISINTNIGEQEYYSGGTWRYMDYSVLVNTEKSENIFHYNGQRGEKSETYDQIARNHHGKINMDEICKSLLSPLSKEELIKISNESEVVFLRNTAKKMLIDSGL